RQVVWRKPAHIFLRESVSWHTCCRKSEISNHAERSPLIERHISHSNGAFLLIRPGMKLEIVVERLIAAIEHRDLVLLFNPTYENGHSASHSTDESFGWISGFSRCEICKTLQLAGCPRNLHTGECEFRGDALQARKHQFLPLTRFSFTKNAMTALSFPYCPAVQRHSIRKKIRVASKLQLLLQTANHAVLSRSQISLKL